jgi:hypothetical protein
VKIKIVALLAVLFIACSALHFVEPTAAAQKGYKIDQGTKYFYDGQTGYQKVTWKTYWYSKNTRKIVRSWYIKVKGKYVYGYTDTTTLQKVSKTKMKITVPQPDFTPPVYVLYKKTKMDNKNFYWKVSRPNIQYHIPVHQKWITK